MCGKGWIIAFLAVSLLPHSACGQEKPGELHGLVRFTGTVPPPKPVATGDGAILMHNDLVVDVKTKGLRWVIAVLEDAPTQPKLDGDEEPVVIDQKDMLFLPRVTAVRHGQPVRFDNSDLFNHSVTIFSAVKENELNVFVTAKDPVSKSFAAEKAPLRIGCSLHGSMTAWLYVAPHPWIAVTDHKGEFVIRSVPPGKYTLLLRHPDTGMLERRPVEIATGQKTAVEIDWKEARPIQAGTKAKPGPK